MDRLRPRVLYAAFDPVPAPKGASTHIIQTVRAIASVADVDLLTLPSTLPDSGGALPPHVHHHPVALATENFLERALEFGDAVARRLMEHEYRVVHVRSVWEGTPAALLQPRRQFGLVYEVNGLPSVELKYHYPGVAENRDLITRLRAQERALLRAASRVITPSDTTRKYVRAQGASGDRIRVTPNGVDPNRFPVQPLPSLARPRILYVGTLAPWQGVPFLIAAVGLLAAERDVELRVVGGGRREWRKECEHLVRKLGLEERVELLPPVPPEDVPALIAASHVCVAPLTITDRNMIQGCCPIKILEYMAAGRPIVAANLPVVREVLTHSETALLYKPDKPRRLAEALAHILEDPTLAAQMAENAAALVRDRFTWAHHNAAVTELYEELLAE